MVTRLQKWGNSLGVRLPKKLADDLNIEPGTEVDIQVVKGRLVLTPLKPRRLNLADLLTKVTRSNMHDEADYGAPRGSESW